MKKHKSKKVTTNKNQNQKGKKTLKKVEQITQSKSKLNQSMTKKGRPITSTGSRNQKRK
ncbi:MAG: hypothetical protein PHS49_05695 [Candidatus Gracilibacteria bacterium]|nr:hypothetical protein [Candidatus Gracilibacteria bacterium]